jgi:hypothetical protein
MMVLASLCLLAGILPGLFIDALAPISSFLIGKSMPAQIGAQWLSIVPIAESRSSYDGLLVFVFMTASGTLAAFAIHALLPIVYAEHQPGIAAIPMPAC